MRTCIKLETITPRVILPEVSVIKTVTLEMTEDEAGKLKLLANELTAPVSIMDHRRLELIRFQSDLWDVLDRGNIEAFVRVETC